MGRRKVGINGEKGNPGKEKMSSSKDRGRRRSSLSSSGDQSRVSSDKRQECPNYMKSTRSFEARKGRSFDGKQQSGCGVKQGGLSGKKTGKKLTRSCSLKLVRTLKKTSSFRVVGLGAKIPNGTCSSVLKDVKFPSYLELHPGGTEAEGTSVFKVCPYKYCSLNGHYHSPVPPLKCFIRARREGMVQKLVQPGRSKVEDDVSVGVLGDKKEENNDFFVEIHLRESRELDFFDEWDSDLSSSQIEAQIDGIRHEFVGEVDEDEVVRSGENLWQEDEGLNDGRSSVICEQLSEFYSVESSCSARTVEEDEWQNLIQVEEENTTYNGILDDEITDSTLSDEQNLFYNKTSSASDLSDSGEGKLSGLEYFNDQNLVEVDEENSDGNNLTHDEITDSDVMKMSISSLSDEQNLFCMDKMISASDLRDGEEQKLSDLEQLDEKNLTKMDQDNLLDNSLMHDEKTDSDVMKMPISTLSDERNLFQLNSSSALGDSEEQKPTDLEHFDGKNLTEMDDISLLHDEITDSDSMKMPISTIPDEQNLFHFNKMNSDSDLRDGEEQKPTDFKHYEKHLTKMDEENSLDISLMHDEITDSDIMKMPISTIPDEQNLFHMNKMNSASVVGDIEDQKPTDLEHFNGKNLTEMDEENALDNSLMYDEITDSDAFPDYQNLFDMNKMDSASDLRDDEEQKLSDLEHLDEQNLTEVDEKNSTNSLNTDKEYGDVRDEEDIRIHTPKYSTNEEELSNSEQLNGVEKEQDKIILSSDSLVSIQSSSSDDSDKTESDEPNMLETDEQTRSEDEHESCNMESDESELRTPYRRRESKSEDEKSNSRRWKIGRGSLQVSLEDEKDYHQREPNFLPAIADPEAEKVDLKHQEMDDRRNSDEWMIDHALQQAVSKLSSVKTRKVELMVEAFETVLPVQGTDNPSFRPIQALG